MKVWVIGAGFSRALGGPLLPDLLTWNALENIKLRVPDSWVQEKECGWCVSVLEKGREKKLWDNAEEFIATIGPCNPPLEPIVAELCPEAFEAFRPFESSHESKEGDFMSTLWTLTISLVAAQCMVFLADARERPELWLPYRRWVRSVEHEDVIVSFNYDEVVEAAFYLAGEKVYCPNARLGQSARSRASPVLLKLHGGIEVRDTIQHMVSDGILNLKSNPPYIGVPGNSKTDHAQHSYGKLWEVTCDALASAEEVALVGYSLPKSDQMAKAMLLDSLSRNSNRPVVDVVLGPGNSPDAQRLVSLLKMCGIDVRDTGIWAEDYLMTCSLGTGFDLPEFPCSDFEEYEDCIQSFRDGL